MGFRSGRAALFFAAALFFVFAAPLFPQAGAAAASFPGDPVSFIGLELGEVLRLLGAPESVYPVRGLEEWQDDVVFVYSQGEVYILKDRVWQLCLKSAYRIAAGDPRSAVNLIFGEALYNGAAYAVFPLKGQAWPMELRFNFDSADRVTAIFVYRSDL